MKQAYYFITIEMYLQALKLMANIHCINRYTKIFIKAAGCVLQKLQLTLGMTWVATVAQLYNTKVIHSNVISFNQ